MPQKGFGFRDLMADGMVIPTGRHLFNRCQVAGVQGISQRSSEGPRAPYGPHL